MYFSRKLSKDSTDQINETLNSPSPILEQVFHAQIFEIQKEIQSTKQMTNDEFYEYIHFRVKKAQRLYQNRQYQKAFKVCCYIYEVLKSFSDQKQDKKVKKQRKFLKLQELENENEILGITILVKEKHYKEANNIMKSINNSSWNSEQTIKINKLKQFLQKQVIYVSLVKRKRKLKHLKQI